ncbi:zinc finger protein 2-like isoform X1 [Planococcus citri]|uniref:zinc finger protein 2-like isoform X1 n=1 Tax=Planococcus citri TaxID=170843 RepID=UPI0031F8D9D7
MLPSELIGVCRLCLVKDQVEVNIFENDSKDIYYRISTCLPVTIASEDKLPKKICLSCHDKINMFYDFWNQTLTTEKHLLSWLNLDSETSNNICDSSQSYSYCVSESNDADINHSTSIDSDENNADSDLENSVDKRKSNECSEPENNLILNVDYQDDKPGPSGFQVEQTSALKQLQGNSYSNSNNKSLDASCKPVSKQITVQDTKEKKTKKLKITLKKKPTSKSSNSKNGKNVKKKAKVKLKPSEETTFKCKHCDEEFDTSLKRRKHEQRTHAKRDVKYDCDKCDYSTYTKGCFTTHLKRHVKQYTLFCEECNIGFFNNTELTSHDIKFHNSQPFQCAICNDMFTSKGNLYSHIKSHDPNNTFVCEICGRTYKKNNSYKRHIARTHLGLTAKAQCTVCQRVLSSKEHLRRHMLTHTDERNWVCSTCGKCFLSKTYLNEHSRIHLGIRPYKCEICEKSFTQRGSLTIHKRSHTGERPFRCEFCCKGFVMSTLLRYHLKKCGEAKLNSHSITNSAPALQMDYNNSMMYDKLPPPPPPPTVPESAEIDPLNNCAVIHSTK